MTIVIIYKKPQENGLNVKRYNEVEWVDWSNYDGYFDGGEDDKGNRLGMVKITLSELAEIKIIP